MPSIIRETSLRIDGFQKINKSTKSIALITIRLQMFQEIKMYIAVRVGVDGIFHPKFNTTCTAQPTSLYLIEDLITGRKETNSQTTIHLLLVLVLYQKCVCVHD